MATAKRPVLHIDRQYAVSLLGPIESTLHELTARLGQYADRVPLSGSDREAIVKAEAATGNTAKIVRQLIADCRDRRVGQEDAS